MSPLAFSVLALGIVVAGLLIVLFDCTRYLRKSLPKGNYMSITIQQMQESVHRLAVEKGWYDCEECNGGRAIHLNTGIKCEFCDGNGRKQRNVPEMLCLIHSEISEALEAYRDDSIKKYQTFDGKPEGFAIELADAIIRIGDMAEYLGIDLTEAIIAKHEYNKTRPHRHGGKKC